MGKTTNILDLNNRLTKVEKENVVQNNYNSLQNRPKINGNLLTGNKTGAQIGLAEAQDITDINAAIGDVSDLDTTATDIVGAINEVKDIVSSIFGSTTELDSSHDLNSLTISGVYFYGSTAPTNIPTNALNSIVSVVRHANVVGNLRILQFIYCFNLDCFFYRKSTDNGNSWGNWNQLAIIT